MPTDRKGPMTLAEFRAFMGPLAAGRTDADLARWKSRLDRLAEWSIEQCQAEKVAERRTA